MNISMQLFGVNAVSQACGSEKSILCYNNNKTYMKSNNKKC